MNIIGYNMTKLAGDVDLAVRVVHENQLSPVIVHENIGEEVDQCVEVRAYPGHHTVHLSLADAEISRQTTRSYHRYIPIHNLQLNTKLYTVKPVNKGQQMERQEMVFIDKLSLFGGYNVLFYHGRVIEVWHLFLVFTRRWPLIQV